MYKHILKNIKTDLSKKEGFLTSLWKNSEKRHAIHDKLPHYIFSAENPMHPSKLEMSHEDTVSFLKDKGYNVEEMNGKYGDEERSILIHNPPKNSLKHLNNFVSSLGQDSAIISDGYDHEMHYLNGPKSGRHHKGQGTVFHRDAPSDFYSTLSDGSHFTHGFDFDNTHKDSKFIKDIAGTLKKSEDFIKNNTFNLRKAESGPSHKLERAGAGTKLIHYSPKQGLSEIHPDHHGVRKIGSEAKQGAPEHRMSFYYAEGVEPESLVTSGSKSKYVVDLGDKKLYDIAKDKHGLHTKAMQKLQDAADKRDYNKGIIMPYEKLPAFHQEIKDAGFHGIFNSGLDKTMSHAVGMFEPMKPEFEHPLHEKDFKETSAKNYHAEDEKLNESKNFASENGHQNHEFLHNLKTKLGK